MKLAVGIVTTAGRETYLQDTLKNLQRQSPEASIQVFCDLEIGLTPNHRASWNRLFENPEVTHALLIQDDVIAAKNWHMTAKLLVERLPVWNVFSLYSGLKFAQQDRKYGIGYLTINAKQWIGEPAVIMSRHINEWIDEFISSGLWRDHIKNSDKQYRHHDVLLQGALIYKGERVVLPCPPIFQHIGIDSTVGNPWRVFGKERRAEGFRGVQWDSYEYFKEKLHVR